MKSASGTRKPYGGTSRSLVLALDVGTTFSGVSYAILEPGEVPKIHGVTRFPGQEHVAGNSKIPSIMYYDSEGRLMAAGAEAESASIVAQAEDEGWVKAELFKLRLRPRAMKLKMNGMRLAPLPRGKNAVDAFGDFLTYLFRCTRSFIIDTHANGPTLWRAVEHGIQFVLSHPNGWEGAQQTKMRRAAVYGGLIPDTDEGRARIRFVTEGEASLHACVLNGLAADVLQEPSGHGFIVADAGGGTLDISSYAIRGTAPLVIEEIAPPDCVFAGSVFVSRRARAFFEEKLKKSKYGTPDSLDHITKRFDETTKRLFRDSKELQFVPFGSPLDKDPTVRIRGGQLTLTGVEVAALFEPSIEAAIASIKAQIEASGGAVKSVWLVGGFAASPWLFSQLQERLAPFQVTVSRPDTQTSKAVADGAIGFYCDHHVSARMSKFMYGVEYLREFDASDDEHVSRKHRLFELPSGPKLLPDAFDCILSRGVRVKESTVFSRKYCTEVTNLSTLSVFEVEIWCYRGGDTVPKWILRNAENFSTLCYVRADLSPLAGSAQSKQGKNGKTYWTIVFNVEIHFGLTEFRARIKWTDNNKTKYGPASIVYNESGHRAEEDEPDSSPEDNMTVLSSHSDRQPSHRSSRTPSRDPVSSSSRSVHSFQRSPKLPSTDTTRAELSRSSSMRSTARSSADKGKERETVVPDVMRESDRAANVSARSVDSARSGSTRLGETLISVWGTPSKQQTRAASPLANSVRSSVVVPKEETVVTPREASKAVTPREVSKAATPKEASKVLTPKEGSSAPTPKEMSKAPTPKEVSKVPTPKETSKTPTPKEVSKAPTPKEASKAPTPKEVSKAPTPKEVSRVGTPRATSKVPTPKSTSRIATPKSEPEPLAEAKPATSITQTVASLWPPADSDAVVPPPPAWAMPSTEIAPAASDPAASDPALAAGVGSTVSPLWDTGSPGDVDGWFKDFGSGSNSAQAPGDLADLMSSPGPDPASGKAGSFSNFLTWGARPTSTFAGGGGGLLSFGSSLFSGISAPLASDATKAAEAEAEAMAKAVEERAAAEEIKKQEEETKRLEDEQARKKHEEEEKKKAEEEAAQKAAQEVARKAEEEETARKTVEEEEAAKKKAEEEEAAKKKAEEEEVAAKKKLEEEETAKKAEEEAEAAKKAADEAEAERKAADEAEAAKKDADEEAAMKKAEEEESAEVSKKAEEAEAAKKAEEEAEAVKKVEEEAEVVKKVEEEADAAKAHAGEVKDQTPGSDPTGNQTDENAEDAQQGEGEQVQEEGAKGKKGKKKKGNGKSGEKDDVPTPEPMSRTASTATTATANTKQSKKPAKKKGKKKGKGGPNANDDEEEEGEPKAPETLSAETPGWGESSW